MGLEPTTFGSEVRRAIHYATKPYMSTIAIYHLLLQLKSSLSPNLIENKQTFAILFHLHSGVF